MSQAHAFMLTECGINRTLHRYNGLHMLARGSLRYCVIALSQTRLDSPKARRFNPGAGGGRDKKLIASRDTTQHPCCIGQCSRNNPVYPGRFCFWCGEIGKGSYVGAGSTMKRRWWPVVAPRGRCTGGVGIDQLFVPWWMRGLSASLPSRHKAASGLAHQSRLSWGIVPGSRASIYALSFAKL